MKKIILILLIICNYGLYAQQNAIIIKKVVGDNLLWPITICDDSISDNFLRQHLKPFGFDSPIPKRNISNVILDTSSIGYIASTINKETEQFERYNYSEKHKPLGMFKVIYVRNSKVEWEKTINHFSILELVLYNSIIKLYNRESIYLPVSKLFIEFLKNNTDPPRPPLKSINKSE